MERGAGSARRRWERVGLECTVVVEVGEVELRARQPIRFLDLT